MGPGMFDGWELMFKAAALALIITIPFAVWKIIEIIIWCCHHIHVGIQ